MIDWFVVLLEGHDCMHVSVALRGDEQIVLAVGEFEICLMLDDVVVPH